MTFHRLVLGWFFVLLTSCGVVNFDPSDSKFIAGTIPSLNGLVYSPSPYNLFPEAVAITCDSDVYARLYEVKSNGELNEGPVASQKLTTNAYRFDLQELGLSLNEKVSYQVEVEGCQERLARPITDYGDKQDITLSSTIVGLVTVSQTTVPLNKADRIEVEKLINSFDGETLYNTYQNLNSTTEASNQFTSIFQNSPLVILEAKPKITFTNIPSLISEGVTTQFKVGAFHIDPSYQFAYEWRLSNANMNSTDTWNFSPTGNQSGTYNVTLYVGKDNGSVGVDTTKPYHIINNIITVANTLPATSIDFTPSVSISDDETISLNLDTGFALGNCETFDSIAITENMAAAPSAGMFIYSCLQSPIQTENFTLSSAEGLKTLRLWTKDAAGNISSSPVTKTVTLDKTAPTITIGSVNSLLKGSSSITVTFGLTDDSTVSASLYYAENGSTYTLVNSLSGSSYNWSVPSHNTSSAKLKIVATDEAGNTSSIESNTFTIDSIAPSAPAVSLTSAGITNSQDLTFTLSSCAGLDGILISESAGVPSLSDSGWHTCTTSESHTLSSTTNGPRSIYVFAKDTAGNISSSSTLSVIFDNVAPLLAITSSLSPMAGGSAYNLGWALTEANADNSQNFAIEIFDGSTWSTLSSQAVSSGPHSSTTFSKSLTIPSLNTTSAKLKIKYTDLAGNPGAVETPAFLVDSTPPTIGTLTLNNGNLNSSNSTIRVGLSATDDLSKITHFCLKYTTGLTAPAAPIGTDACWIAVNAPVPGITPDKNITFSNYFYSLGILSSLYNVYGWTKNNVGLISSLSNSNQGTLNVDYAQVNYAAGVPPTLINVTSSTSDTTSLTIPSADLAVNSGETIYIKWKATDDYPLPANSVSLSYTLDENSYTIIATDLANASNGGCSVDGTNYTGCYTTTAPSSSYFKIKVTLSDDAGMSSIMNALPNNTGSFNILAGNTEPGVGGSASSAVFNLDSGSTVSNVPGSFVISDNGIFYIRDMVNGVLKIDPSNGIVTQLLPIASSQLDGPIGTATLRLSTAFMTLDYQGNLLFFDYTKIRKLDLTTNTVSTIIGGGSIRATNTNALDFKVQPCNTTKSCQITVLPNGDIYFMDNPNTTGAKIIWKYTASNNRVYAIDITGNGINNYSTSDDISTSDFRMTGFSLAFDVTNSNVKSTIIQAHPVSCPGCGQRGYTAFVDITTGNTIPSPKPAKVPSGIWAYKSTPTAKDGKIYHLAQETKYSLSKFDETTNTWTDVLGTGNPGFCEDGTDALSCDVFAMDVFITSDSRIFFISNGLIRTIDADNKVQTLFGQRRLFGDGGLATSARINSVPFFDFFSNGDIVFYDTAENIIRSFTPGGNITRVAGNGSTTTTSGALATETGLLGTWWGGDLQMAVDENTDNIYFMTAGRVAQVKKSDGILNMLSGFTTNYDVADGLPLSDIRVSVAGSANLLGIKNGQILLSMYSRNASAQDYKCYLKSYDSTNNFIQSHIAGNDNLCTNDYSPDGTPTSTADVGRLIYNMLLMAEWFPDLNGWIVPRSGWTNTLKSYAPGGTVETVVALPKSISSFTVVKNVDDQNVVFYCASGRIYKYNISTSTQTALPWPGDTYACTGFKIKYHTGRGSIIFPYTKSGLAGIAEIVTTP